MELRGVKITTDNSNLCYKCLVVFIELVLKPTCVSLCESSQIPSNMEFSGHFLCYKLSRQHYIFLRNNICAFGAT